MIDEALEYWSNESRLSEYYLGRKMHTDIFIDALKLDFPSVRSLLEFGCGTGRNLHFAKHDLPQIESANGIDINASLIEEGRKHYPDIKLLISSDGLDLLDYTPSKSKDVVFTISVLDHLPDRDLVLKAITHFFRIARLGVMLFEPNCGVVGPVYPEYTNVPFSYSWDYLRIFQELWEGGSVRNIGLVRTAQWDISTGVGQDKGLGKFYTLYSCDVKNGSREDNKSG